MQDLLKNLKDEIENKIKAVKDDVVLENLRVEYLGRKGKFTEALKSIKKLQAEEKPLIGKLANEIKLEIEHIFNETKNILAGAGQEKNNKIYDTSLPGQPVTLSGLHPITKIIYDLNDVFRSLNFEIYEGNELSNEKEVFDDLNFPPGHPARESMDTYWLKQSEKNCGVDRLCLRPHLTGASVQYMRTHQPPFQFVYPGRVFRLEATDAGHERCFYQYEALIVNKDFAFSAGKIMINTILERVFGHPIETRMRAGFFPFVEPGFEIDMQCQVCHGHGCSVCKHNGWLEVMPGGAPHPNVLKAGGLDPKVWQGFYINVGLDRLAMMKYGIDDVRLMHSGDLRFLKQF